MIERCSARRRSLHAMYHPAHVIFASICHSRNAAGPRLVRRGVNDRKHPRRRVRTTGGMSERFVLKESGLLRRFLEWSRSVAS